MPEPTPPPPITAITLGVRDVAASTDFYCTGLGFGLIHAVPSEITFVQAGPGLMLALWNVASMPSEYGAVGHGSLAPPMSLGHNVADAATVQRMYDVAVAAGATSINPPTAQSWGGTSACVADPDGFRWDFVFNPAFQVDPDGTVRGV
ncbi:MAG: VOC family protein [Gordonia sp. (in: high G+C Gram-positive bacteria)]|uniref:VOC family protein n=1 Tax=Gordonia sp. (in: high G+C Gram-positive bacteria) TaxID=84139 RepID=UPI003C76831D